MIVFFLYAEIGFVFDPSLPTAALTVILHRYFFPDTVAVIVAEPAFLAVTFPLVETVATDFLEERHLIFFFVPLTFNL